MNAIGLIGLALLILLLLPVVIAAWEGYGVPDMLYLVIASGGIIFAGVTRGWAGALQAGLVGLGCLIVVAAAITAIRLRWQVRLLVGGHIKLLGAGATWLGVAGSIGMIAISLTLLAGGAVFLRIRKNTNIRPEFIPIAAASILLVQIGYIF
ncbi:MAG TPA: hypothetical protein VNS79_15875 [Sphingobium sp.]|nr:hypothetical protein [Sphingobium sp.]